MERWKLDPAFSAVTFSLPRMGPASPKGKFLTWEGTFTTEDGAWLSASVDLKIDASSLVTGDPEAAKEALSDRFLDAARYPHIVFASREVESIEDAHVVLVGDLTIRDITHPLCVGVDFIGRARDLAGNDRMSWEIEGKVSRSAYGLHWHPTLEDVAGFIIGDTIAISGELEFIREP